MKAKILVVDDERLILTTIERALGKLDYAIHTAASMKDLDTVLDKAPFDLLLTDVYLEDAQAEDIIAKVRSCSPLVKILRMSGSGTVGKGEDFLEKPFRLESLRDKVRQILNEPS